MDFSSRLHRIANLIFFVGGTILLLHLFSAFLFCSIKGYSSTRAVIAVALARGLTIYPTEAGGNLVISMYPPFFPISYLPSGFFPTPFTVLFSATLISALFTWVPAFFLMWKLVQEQIPEITVRSFWPSTLFLFLLFAFFPSLGITLGVHSDPVATGYAAMALLLLSRKKIDAVSLAGTALLLTFSIYCKQTYATLVPSVLLWITWRSGWKTGARFALYFGAIFTVISALLIGYFGLEALRLNCLEIPAAHPWNHRNAIMGEKLPPDMYAQGFLGRIEALIALICIWVTEQWAVLLAGLALVVNSFFPHRSLKSNFQKAEMAFLVMLTCLAVLPTSIIGRLKVGGVASNILPLVYFLTILGTAAFSIWTYRHAQWRLPFLSVAVAMIALPVLLQTVLRLNRYTAFEQDRVYHYLRQSDHHSYFPFEPLAHLLAENRLIPTADTLWNFDLAKRSVPFDPILQQLNGAPSEIVFTPDMVGVECILLRFPHYVPSPDPLPELNGYWRYLPPPKK